MFENLKGFTNTIVNKTALKHSLRIGWCIINNFYILIKMFTQEVKTESQYQSNQCDLEPSQSSLSLSLQKLSELRQCRQNMVKLMKDVTNKIVRDADNVIYQFCGKYSKLGEQQIDGLELANKRIERMVKNKKLKKNWSFQDMKILSWVVIHYCDFKAIRNIYQMTITDWRQISKFIPGTSALSCMFKVLGLKKTKISQQKWTQIQSNLLSQIVSNSSSFNWKQMSEQLYLKNNDPNKIFRNAKQCKEHWSCYLNPNKKKGPWQLDEDIALLEYVVSHQLKRKWTELAKTFQRRTQNALKNRYGLIIDKIRSLHCGKSEDFLKNQALKMLRKEKLKKEQLKQSQCSEQEIQQEKVLKQEPKQLLYQTIYLPQINSFLLFLNQMNIQ